VVAALEVAAVAAVVEPPVKVGALVVVAEQLVKVDLVEAVATLAVGEPAVAALLPVAGLEELAVLVAEAAVGLAVDRT
jgi:hypothetical protein